MTKGEQANLNQLYSRMGSVESHAESIQGEVTEFKDEVEKDLTRINGKLDDIQKTLSQQKGGLKVFFWAMGILGTLTSSLWWLFTHIGAPK